MPAHQTEPSNDLEVAEDRRWQEFFWTAQRIGWALMGLFMLGAILGITGSGGALATEKAETSAGTVDYPAITRWEAGEEVVFRLPASAASKAELTLSPEFDRVFSTDSISPEPSSAAATAQGHRYTFDLEGPGEKQIVFNVTGGKPTIARRVSVRIGQGPPADLTVTVLP